MQNGQIQNYENAIYDIHSNFILFEGYSKTLFFHCVGRCFMPFVVIASTYKIKY